MNDSNSILDWWSNSSEDDIPSIENERFDDILTDFEDNTKNYGGGSFAQQACFANEQLKLRHAAGDVQSRSPPFSMLLKKSMAKISDHGDCPLIVVKQPKQLKWHNKTISNATMAKKKLSLNTQLLPSTIRPSTIQPPLNQRPTYRLPPNKPPLKRLPLRFTSTDHRLPMKCTKTKSTQTEPIILVSLPKNLQSKPKTKRPPFDCTPLLPSEKILIRAPRLSDPVLLNSIPKTQQAIKASNDINKIKKISCKNIPSEHTTQSYINRQKIYQEIIRENINMRKRLQKVKSIVSTFR